MGGFKVQGRAATQAQEAPRRRRARSSRPAVTRSCSRASRASWPREITDAVSIPTIGIGAGVRLRRPGAGDLRPARHERGVPAQVRQALRQPRGPHPHRRRAVRHRGAQRAVSRRGAHLLQGGAAAPDAATPYGSARARPAAAAPSAIPTPPARRAFRCRFAAQEVTRSRSSQTPGRDAGARRRLARRTASASRSCRRWATCTTATCRCSTKGAGAATCWCCRSSSTRRSSGPRRICRATRAISTVIWPRPQRAGVDVVFVPDAAAMYPPGYQTYVEVRELQKGLCGAQPARPLRRRRHRRAQAASSACSRTSRSSARRTISSCR